MLTIEQLRECGLKLDDARKDPAARCPVPIKGEDGQTFRLVPIAAGMDGKFRRLFGNDAVIVENGRHFHKVLHGQCGYRYLAIDPATGRIGCAKHGRGQ